MTATTWGANYDGGPGGTGTDFNTAANWVGDGGPGSDAVIDNTNPAGTYSVEVNATPASSIGSYLRVYRGAELSINASMTVSGGGDLLIDYAGGSTVNMNAGTLTLNDKVKISENGGACTFYMNGGAVTVGDDFEIYSGGLLEISGGNFNAGGDSVELRGGTFRVIGNAATISVHSTDDVESGAAYEFVPNALGQVSKITSGDTKSAPLSVDLDALTAPSTMTLFDGGFVETFTNVTITQGAITLTPGTAGSLALNEYALTLINERPYEPNPSIMTNDGMMLEVNVAGGPDGDDIPEPVTMCALGLAVAGLGGYVRRRRKA